MPKGLRPGWVVLVVCCNHVKMLFHRSNILIHAIYSQTVYITDITSIMWTCFFLCVCVFDITLCVFHSWHKTEFNTHVTCCLTAGFLYVHFVQGFCRFLKLKLRLFKIFFKIYVWILNCKMNIKSMIYRFSQNAL